MAATRGQWLLRNPALAFGLGRTDRRALELALARDETWSGQARGAPVEVRCASGTVWVTFEGDVEDHVLSEGDSFVAARPGRLVMMALLPARVRVVGRVAERRGAARAPRARSPAA